MQQEKTKEKKVAAKKDEEKKKRAVNSEYQVRSSPLLLRAGSHACDCHGTRTGVCSCSCSCSCSHVHENVAGAPILVLVQ